MNDDRPLFVRLPADAAEKLDRASYARRTSKKDLVAALVAQHLEPPAGETAEPLVVSAGETTLGRHSFRPADEVLTLAGLAELLRLDETAVRGLAEAGELPGRRIGDEWRFSRAAVLTWLGEG